MTMDNEEMTKWLIQKAREVAKAEATQAASALHERYFRALF